MAGVDLDPTQQLGKFVVITGSPPNSPGCCFLCNTAKQGIRYIDPRRDLEWQGTIYFCEECVIEMGQNLGMLDFGLSADLLDDNRILHERIEAANKQIEDLEQTVDLLSQRRLSDRVISSSGYVATSSEALSGDTETAEGIKSAITDAEHELNESVDEQGPDDLSTTGSNKSDPDDPIGL